MKDWDGIARQLLTLRGNSMHIHQSNVRQLQNFGWSCLGCYHYFALFLCLFLLKMTCIMTAGGASEEVGTAAKKPFMDKEDIMVGR